VFTPEFVVIGPLTLDKSYSYYGANTASKKDVNISEFYMDAIQKALESYSGWNEFDNDNNGTVDMAFFIFAGPGENQSGISKEHIWPKENPDGGTVGDTEIGCYACCGELTYDEFAGIGTFCHELSHALGLTDTYDYNGVAYGMGYWDLMDSGCYNKNDQAPCDYTAYQKDFMGWRDIVTIDPSVKQTLTLKPISDGGVGYKIVNPENVDEYYIIENRQNLNWDKYVGLSTDVFGYHHGMTVCHIDYSYEAWTNNIVNCDASHQRMTLVPGDGELTPTTEYTSGAISAEEFINGIGGDVFPGNAYADQLKGVKMPLFTSAGHCSYSLNDIWEHSDGTVTVKIGFTDILDRPSIKSAKDYLVNWTSVENAQSYVVQTSSSPQFKSDLSTDSVANVLQTTLSGLSESSVYLRVRALSDDVLNSEWSPIVILSNGNLKLLSVGDVNADGYVNVADIISMVNYFLAGDVFVNPDTSDINGDGSLSVADIIALISIVAK
jgi:M6 family metalloprotease-like protein